jgi:hypothetical protein
MKTIRVRGTGFAPDKTADLVPAPAPRCARCHQAHPYGCGLPERYLALEVECPRCAGPLTVVTQSTAAGTQLNAVLACVACRKEHQLIAHLRPMPARTNAEHTRLAKQRAKESA